LWNDAICHMQTYRLKTWLKKQNPKQLWNSAYGRSTSPVGMSLSQNKP